ncbi:hypothetical protein Taro_004172 [Colocasia esculenta]|uniref:DNA-directed RNA polymerase subunit n=1 Tax=Colocasia esculenta TaxID=4460 RepID=A0A843TP90_COLES|nr:hypothetical protein [Colocasia esculenta]
MELSTPQALRVSDADLGVYVHPSNSKRIQQALCRQLSIALFTFNETFDGVLLAYSLGLPKKTAKILPGLIPYFCVTVKAKLLLFSPKPDMLLGKFRRLVGYGCQFGTYLNVAEFYELLLVLNLLGSLLVLKSKEIQKIKCQDVFWYSHILVLTSEHFPICHFQKENKESIYVIILGFCAAAITSEDIREEFNYKIKDGVGIFSSIYHKRHVIKPGTMLRFSVKSFDEEMLHISGSLIPPGTGCVPWLAKHGIAEGLKVDRSVKKQSKRGREMEMEQDLDLLNEGDLSLSPGVQNKFRRTT